jgi:NADP-dependent 3-hydroxy acid dehydrogenase YdfG
MHVDLADLSTIKPGVEKFLAQESRLDVLTNNAGVSVVVTACHGVNANKCTGHDPTKGIKDCSRL